MARTYGDWSAYTEVTTKTRTYSDWSAYVEVATEGGLKSRSRRRRYVTYTEPTTGQPNLPHAPRRIVRLADFLKLPTRPAPDLPTPPRPLRITAGTALISQPISIQAFAGKVAVQGGTAVVAQLRFAADVETLSDEIAERAYQKLTTRLEENEEDEILALLLSRLVA